MDEAYQADAATYFTVADLAPTHFLVGDAGQLEPFSAAPDPNLFRGLPHDPLQTAVGALRRHATLSGERAMPCTYRLPRRSAELARSFYLGINFRHAIRDGARELRLRPAEASDAEAVYDRVLETATAQSLAHLELRGQGAPDDDPEMVDAIAKLVRRFFERRPAARVASALIDSSLCSPRRRQLSSRTGGRNRRCAPLFPLSNWRMFS